MGKLKQKLSRSRHEFLLTFFDDNNRYEAIEVHGYTLVRQFNANNDQWEVAIWRPGTYKTFQNLPFLFTKDVTGGQTKS